MVTSMSLRAEDFAIRVTPVAGNAITGKHATDGSWNVVVEPSGILGMVHPCGALSVYDATGETTMGTTTAQGWLRVTTDSTDRNGAIYVSGLSIADPGQAVDFSDETLSYYTAVLLDDPF